MAHLAERGWVCVTVNYRLSPTATWPDHIVDVKRALRLDQGAPSPSHGGDPRLRRHHRRLGRRAPVVARRAHARTWPTSSPASRTPTPAVAAAVPFYGVYDFIEPRRHRPRRTWRTSSADACSSRSSPRTASGGSRHRPIEPRRAARATVLRAPRHQRLARPRRAGPLRSSTMLREALRSSRSSTPSCPAPSTRSTSFPSVRTHATVHAVERFLAVVRSEQGGQTPAEAVDEATVAAPAD